MRSPTLRGIGAVDRSAEPRTEELTAMYNKRTQIVTWRGQDERLAHRHACRSGVAARLLHLRRRQQHHQRLAMPAGGDRLRVQPRPQSNAPIYGIARRIRAKGQYAAVTVCFMDLNKPSIPDTINAMAARGISHMIATPYFLQLGNHVRDDLPAIIATARTRHPTATILLTEHLAYDRLLVSVIADRVREVVW